MKGLSSAGYRTGSSCADLVLRPWRRRRRQFGIARAAAGGKTRGKRRDKKNALDRDAPLVINLFRFRS
jgi:hypothetical protein